MNATQEEELSEDELTDTMVIDTEWWERFLYTTGGKLKLSKCFWYIITWKWIGGTAKMKKRPSPPTN